LVTNPLKKETGGTKMYGIGRLCVKIAGRDAGKKCVIVDILKSNYVLIDGETRRRKCNLIHLEPLDQIIKINKEASNVDIVKEFKKLKMEVNVTKPKKATEKPKKARKKRTLEEKATTKSKPKEKPKTATKTTKKTEKPKKKTTKATTKKTK